ncbi:MAG: hypothetical protein RMM51_03145 [Verrucomicrobiae bacterium]|nr:hypothetical protein [Verrucomicrobiae bacterium]
MLAAYYRDGMWKPSREFKATVTAWGFFVLSVGVVVLLVWGIWNARTSRRATPPPPTTTQ